MPNLEELKLECEVMGLTMNVSKIKIIATDVPEGGIQIDDLKTGKTLEYTYLGQIMSYNNKTDKEIGKRIANGWKAY